MLIQEQTPSVQYIYLSGATEFTIPWPFYQDTDIRIAVKEPDAGKLSDIYELEKDIDFEIIPYTTLPIGIESGAVRFLRVFPNNTLMEIYRKTPIEQTYHYVEQDKFPAESHENGLSKQICIDQEINYFLERCLKIPYGSDADPEQVLEDIINARGEILIATDEAKAARDEAIAAADRAKESENWAYKWANNPWLQEVKDGEYSAYHWAKEAEQIVRQGIEWGSDQVSWRIDEDLPANSIITLPVQYPSKCGCLTLIRGGLVLNSTHRALDTSVDSVHYEEQGQIQEWVDTVKILQEVPGPSYWSVRVNSSGAIGPAPTFDADGTVVDEEDFFVELTADPDTEGLYHFNLGIPRGPRGFAPNLRFTAEVAGETSVDYVRDEEGDYDITLHLERGERGPAPNVDVTLNGEKRNVTTTWDEEDQQYIVDFIVPSWVGPARTILYEAGSYTAIPAGGAITTPSYIVGRGEIEMYIDGLYCAMGDDAGRYTFMENGTDGEESTSVVIHSSLPNTYELFFTATTKLGEEVSG